MLGESRYGEGKAIKSRTDSPPTASFVAPNPMHAPARNLPLSFKLSYLERIESHAGRNIGSTASFADPQSPPS